jgi:hypothetical protein
VPTVPADEDALTRAIIALASEYGRYGYRRVTALLRQRVGRSGKTGFSGSGVVRGSRFRKSIGRAAVFG